MSTPIRVLPIAPDEALVSVRKELGARGTGIIAWDRTRDESTLHSRHQCDQ